MTESIHQSDGHARPSHFLSTKEFSQVYLGRRTPHGREGSTSSSPSRATHVNQEDRSASLLELPSPERAVPRLDLDKARGDALRSAGAQRPRKSHARGNLAMYAPQADVGRHSRGRKRPSRAQALRQEVRATRTPKIQSVDALYDIFISDLPRRRDRTGQGSWYLAQSGTQAATPPRPHISSSAEPRRPVTDSVPEAESVGAANGHDQTDLALRNRVVRLEQRLSRALNDLDAARRDQRVSQVHEMRVELQVVRSECCRLEMLLKGRSGRAARSMSPPATAARVDPSGADKIVTQPCDLTDGKRVLIDELRHRTRELERHLAITADENAATQTRLRDTERKLQQVSLLYGDAQATCVQAVAKMEQFRSEAAALKKEVNILQSLPQQVLRLQRDLDESRGQVIEADRLVARYKEILGDEANASPESIRCITTERDRLVVLLQQQKQTEAVLRRALAEQQLDRQRQEAFTPTITKEDEAALKMDREQQYERQIHELQQRVEELNKTLQCEREATALKLASMSAEHEEDLVERLLSRHATAVAPPSASQPTPLTADTTMTGTPSRVAVEPSSATSAAQHSPVASSPSSSAAHQVQVVVAEQGSEAGSRFDAQSLSVPSEASSSSSASSASAASSSFSDVTSVASAESVAEVDGEAQDERVPMEQDEHSISLSKHSSEASSESLAEHAHDTPDERPSPTQRTVAPPTVEPPPSSSSSSHSASAVIESETIASQPQAIPAPVVQALDEHPLADAANATMANPALEVVEATTPVPPVSVAPLVDEASFASSSSSDSMTSSSLNATTPSVRADKEDVLPWPPVVAAPAPVQETGSEHESPLVVKTASLAVTPSEETQTVEPEVLPVPVEHPSEKERFVEEPTRRVLNKEEEGGAADTSAPTSSSSDAAEHEVAASHSEEARGSADASSVVQLPSVLPDVANSQSRSPPCTPHQQCGSSDHSPEYIVSTSARVPHPQQPLFSGEEVHLNLMSVPEPLEAYSHQTSYALAHEYSGNASFGLSEDHYLRAQQLLYDVSTAPHGANGDPFPLKSRSESPAPPLQPPSTPSDSPDLEAVSTTPAGASNANGEPRSAATPTQPSEPEKNANNGAQTDVSAQGNTTSLEQSPIPRDDRDYTRFSGVNLEVPHTHSPAEMGTMDTAPLPTAQLGGAASERDKDNPQHDVPSQIPPPPAPPPLPTAVAIKPFDTASGPAVVPPPPTIPFFAVPAMPSPDTGANGSSSSESLHPTTLSSSSVVTPIPAPDNATASNEMTVDSWVPPPPPPAAVPLPPPPPAAQPATEETTREDEETPGATETPASAGDGRWMPPPPPVVSVPRPPTREASTIEKEAGSAEQRDAAALANASIPSTPSTPPL